jgi:leucyl/phenylalanyl-tRNA---protein transferase
MAALRLGPSWLSEDPEWFPPQSSALTKPNGLLAIGGDLSPERLIAAYSRGIFPWCNPGEPLLWWSPDPRMVFYPGAVHISKSLRKALKQPGLAVTCDTDFRTLMTACQAKRAEGTWISDALIESFCALHQAGLAHSLEARSAKGDLLGGFYGLSLGGIFFGESMVSLAPNGSKLALAVFSDWAATQGFSLIDCQVENPHLVSLGGQRLSRSAFLASLTTINPETCTGFNSHWAAAKHCNLLTADRLARLTAKPGEAAYES